MGFVRVVKNKSYFQRFQVKYRRRREGKTDYRQRKRLVAQDKNKYQTPRYRLVVRLTNQTVICQIISSEIEGDKVFCSAYSSELPRFGLKVGLKNYAAAYCTGLLVARRVLKKLGMDSKYQGNTKIDAQIHTTTDTTDSGKEKFFWVAELNEERNPFKCVLDIGVRATTTGARIFGALKGASDGGLNIPHSERRFPGYNREAKTYDADAHRQRIFGQHVATYMNYLKDEDEDKLKAHFSKYLKEGVTADKVEALYQKVHKAIRANPDAKAKSNKPHDKKYKKAARRTLAERKAAIVQKKQERIAKLARVVAAGNDEDDE